MECKNPKVTLMLLKAGADPLIKDHWGKTALDHARGKETEAVAAVLTQWIAAHPHATPPH
jgi:hypothetical protein